MKIFKRRRKIKKDESAVILSSKSYRTELLHNVAFKEMIGQDVVCFTIFKMFKDRDPEFLDLIEKKSREYAGDK